VSPDNVDQASERYDTMKGRFDQSFNGFQHDFHFIQFDDFPQTMNLFVADYHIDIIATLPKDHSWLTTLFGGSNTKKLAYQSSIPVLAIH
jgi:hypothetical protein